MSMYYALKEKKSLHALYLFIYWFCISIALVQLLGLKRVVSVLMTCNGVILSLLESKWSGPQCNSPLQVIFFQYLRRLGTAQGGTAPAEK